MNIEKFNEIIQDFCLFDNIFMRICLADDKESIELILSIILPEIKGLKVTEVKTEYDILSLSNKSVSLDAYAVDETGKLYDIEIQKDDRGATGKRARYNGSLMDLDFLKKGKDYKELPTRYVVMISENGYNCYDEPLKEYVYQSKDGRLLDDETHIVYVNGQNKSNSELGKLIQDLHNKDYSTMNYKTLADKVRYYKTTEKGRIAMDERLAELFKDDFNEKLLAERIKVFANFLKIGINAEQIQKAMELNDNDYKTIYPLALKLAQ